MKLVFRVDLPPKALNPNQARHVHWTDKNDITVAYKLQVSAAARNAMLAARWVKPERARVSLWWGLLDKRLPALKRRDPRYHPEDSDNAVAAGKALIDGLTLAGAIVDDRWESMELGRVHATRDDGPWVEIEIEAV